MSKSACNDALSEWSGSLTLIILDGSVEKVSGLVVRVALALCARPYGARIEDSLSRRFGTSESMIDIPLLRLCTLV